MDLERELLKGNTPTLVLAILRDGPLHGYGIARELERRSGDVLQFKDGTLYPTLHSLEADGLIESHWDNPEKGQARKVYEITPSGLAALERRTEHWRSFVDAVETVIGGNSHGKRRKPAPGE
jgi:PadR family transcriptional regulator PadR